MLKRALTTLLTAGIGLACATSASAASTTYCVDAPSCNGIPSANLQAALDSAQASPDADRVEIGPGSFFPGPGSFTYAGSPTNRTTIVGAGAGQTHIVATTASANVLVLNYADISDLEVQGAPPLTPKVAPAALELAHGTGSRLKLTDGVTGARLEVGATLASSDVTGSGATSDTGAGVDSTGSGTVVVDSTVDCPLIGVRVSGSVSVIRSHITSQTATWIVDGGIARVTDSLLEGPALGPSSAVRALGSGNSEHQAVITGTTISEPSTGGMGVLAEGSDASKIDISVTNSAISAGNWAFLGYLQQGSTSVTVANSAFDPAKVHGNASFDFGVGNVSDAPGFVDPAAHDFRLRGDSPLIDAGTSTPTGGIGSADLGGGPRSLDGDGDGTALPDIGAFEAPAVAPPVDPKPPTDPKPPVGSTDPAPVLSAVTLTHKRFKVQRRATAFRFKLSEAARVTIQVGSRKLVRTAHAGANRISFGGKLGSAALKRGRYTARVMARDAAGHASKTRKVSFRVV